MLFVEKVIGRMTWIIAIKICITLTKYSAFFKFNKQGYCFQTNCLFLLPNAHITKSHFEKTKFVSNFF